MATKANQNTNAANAKDLLSSLTAGKKALPKKNAVNRPEMEMSAELEEHFKSFADADAVQELVNPRIEQEKSTVNQGCFDLWCERLWKTKNRPANPSLEIEKEGQQDIYAIYQVQERYSLNLPEVPENKSLEEVVTELFVDLLTAKGMAKEDAEKAANSIVSDELTLTPKPIIDLDRLVNGHYEGEGKNKTFVDASKEEQAVATKLLQIIACRGKKELGQLDPITDDEQSMLVEYKPQMVVKKGFLQRVSGYVNSLDQLKAIFSVIRPVRYPQVKKWGASDTPEEKNQRLVAAFGDILGLELKIVN